MSGRVDAEQFRALLRISSAIDIVGDVSVTVAHPADLTAWSCVLEQGEVSAWRAHESGHRFVQVSAISTHAPVHGRVTAVLNCERHPEFWAELVRGHLARRGRESHTGGGQPTTGDLAPGAHVRLSSGQLTEAWLQATATAADDS
jgi:hypothetical protein